MNSTDKNEDRPDAAHSPGENRPVQPLGADVHAALKSTFGFDSFRPLQEAIIRDVLGGHDVFGLLPTGGGKSLCYQLPAVLRGGLTLVVSPLIALMKDQVDGLRTAGVAATFLNSSLDAHEARARLRGLHQGEYRLLYIAPERLLLPGFLETIKQWQIKLVAIDEAHCISEWGHDFRPEYRQIAELREQLPGAAFLALTATATDRVRSDILASLKLREPRCYVGSFNRANLCYRVIPKNQPFVQALEFIRERPHESGIVYCQSRKTADSLAARLTEEGVQAKPYHAGLESEERSRHQELFLRDDIRVICATIAFGMGINKPNVRFVMHYDLPKNIEGYYQETGRAGRDGLPAECLLLFSASDVIKQQQFISEKTAQEQQIARTQLARMVHFAEAAQCRRGSLLQYFSETYPDANCQGCDNCLSPRRAFDGTIPAQKFLSCVYRVRERSGFSVGVGHITEVLTAAHTEKVRRWGHDQISTYGIGKDHSRTEWAAIGRELVRLQYLRQNPDKFNVLELTEKGREALAKRSPIMLTTELGKPTGKIAPRAGQVACDEVLFEKLRELRKQLADERNVPAYVIFSDVALRQMARDYPSTREAFSRISGVGEKKLAEFGLSFLEEIAGHLASHSRQTFEAAAPAPAQPREISDTVRETLRRFRSGQEIDGIAADRKLARSTIFGHLLAAAQSGEPIELRRFISVEQEQAIAAAFSKIGAGNLTGIFEMLGGKFEYDILRLYRAKLSSNGS
jgi:ATP-dependent DNA helicase RecQ